MILRNAEKYIRSSAVLVALPYLGMLTVYTASLVAFDQFLVPLETGGTELPFSASLSTIIAFLLVFRTNTAYERYMMGRAHWQDIISLSKNLGRILIYHCRPQEYHFGPNASITLDMIKTERITALRHLLLFLHSVMKNLRDEHTMKRVDEDYFRNDPRYEHMIFKKSNEAGQKAIMESLTMTALPAAEINRKDSAASQLIIDLDSDLFKIEGAMIAENPLVEIEQITRFVARHSLDPRYHTIHSQLANVIEIHLLSKIVDNYNGCLKILRTPIPRAYSILLSCILFLFCVTFPISILHKFKWWTILISLVIHYVFLGVDAIAKEIENPFGVYENDLPIERFIFDIECELKRLLMSSEFEGQGE
eukprot:Partr_v1_DN25011_c1_g1_i1_m50726 putative Bestrophin, RFP-TM, chloride channel